MPIGRTIRLGEKVPLRLTAQERDLILGETFVGPEITEPLELAPVEDKAIVVLFTLDDLDDLVGHIAAQANHAKTRSLQRKLDALCDKIRKIEDSYDDSLPASS